VGQAARSTVDLGGALTHRICGQPHQFRRDQAGKPVVASLVDARLVIIDNGPGATAGWSRAKNGFGAAADLKLTAAAGATSATNTLTGGKLQTTPPITLDLPAGPYLKITAPA